jgi:hypothetical protein
MAATASFSTRNWSMTIFYIILIAAATYLMRIYSNTHLSVGDYMENTVSKGAFPNGIPLSSKFTGIQGLDFAMGFLIVAFIDGSAGWDPAIQLQQIHFLFSYFAVISIMEIEACRRRSGWTIGSLSVALPKPFCANQY